MTDKSVLVSTIALVDDTNVDALRTVRESFRRQTWPHKELILVNQRERALGEPGEIRPLNGESPLAAGVKAARGHICVVWTPGWWYHQNVLGIHAKLVDPWLRVELCHALDEPSHSYSFFRRAYAVLDSPKMKLRQVGAVGLVEKIAANHDLRGWSLYHSGNLGDIIYSLPAMKVLGFGVYYLGVDTSMNPKPDLREVMSPKLVQTIAPLMLAQPYVRAVYFTQHMPIVSYDLNLFRNFAAPEKNLVAQSLDACCLSAENFFNDQTPWLDVDPVPLRRGVVVHRSHRWRNPSFPWAEVYDRFRAEMVFVGTSEEHASFVSDFGLIPYVPTPNLLELARIIAGCHLFIGNQSCPYAIAEGLKVNTLQETFPQIANCLFQRPNAVYGRDKFVYIPGLKQWPPNPRRQRRWFHRSRLHRVSTEVDVIERPKDYKTFYIHQGESAVVGGLHRSVSMETTHLFDHARMLQAIPMPPPMQRNVIQWTLGRKGRVEAWFNPSLVLRNGRRWLAYRCECIPWFRLSMVALSELDANWNPILEGTTVMNLHSKFGNYCVEDPRFFVYKDNLWLSYTDAHETALARLNEDMTTADSFYLERPWFHTRPEKNWTFFETEGRLYAVYALSPHKIIEVNTQDRTTRFAHEVRYTFKWNWGELRGGSSPVMHEGLYWSFFHSSINIRDESYGPIRQYLIGVYAFEPRPPFTPVWMSQQPLLAGEEEQLQHDRPSQHSVVFPCGSLRLDHGWLVSFGENDCRCRMAFFDDEIVHKLQKL
jgi:predicted GH43/DUF377 family glycosyl hydrolase